MAWAQETINTNILNLIVLGGDQKSTGASIELLPIAIIDIEPETLAGAGGGAGAGTEAGLPPPSSGGADLSNLWINFTHRAQNYQPARIYVSTNQPIPNGMKIEVQITQTGTGGNYPKNPNTNKIRLSQTEQVIVYDFANGYTGDGLNRGYHITYTISNSKTLPAGFEVIYRIQ
ncbi:hypothetical protein AWN68_15545 [Roseivirga echinicomitans]|uniref:Uncharacterized protein n=2 Tax=Roseivirga echinicomitans TaxID=296218 RepID=A0A150XU98_9BACT|nr:hypothetical protein AWN68_15545 [Roseivirga echinicomitans]